MWIKIKLFKFMQKKNIVIGLVSLVSLSFLSGCGNKEISSENNSVDKTDNQTDEINIVKNDKLAVDQNKCVGCGKCAKIAPANFEMNSSRKAQVKSNELTNQGLVSRAVSNCPVGAINQ